MVDIDHVADGRLPVHVVECRARAHRHQVAAHDRHRIALVEVQPVQVGPIELQREIIGGHRIVESQWRRQWHIGCDKSARGLSSSAEPR